MTLKNYITLMSFCTLVCWSVFVYVLLTISPNSGSWVGIGLFYATLFFSLSGTFAILGFWFRFVALKRELAFHAVKTAFRQSFLFAFLVLATLFLESKDLLSWVNLSFLIGALVLLESFWLSHSRSKVRKIVNN